MPAQRTILFHRDFLVPSGGHLKVWHYYCHATHSARFRPRVYLTPASLRDGANPWTAVQPPPLAEWKPGAADALFVGGLDWTAVPDPCPVPVINLVQHVRHADPGDPRRSFLSRPAIRICVGREVADAIRGTGLVNGPVHVIPNALDPAELPRAGVRDIPVLVAGAKNPGLATLVRDGLAASGVPAECLLGSLPRREFLALLGRAEVAVTLPHRHEGFFLPALEAMALGAIVVCPDCVGNRSFCRDGENAFRPAYSAEAVAAAVLAARALGPVGTARMREAAAAEAAMHGIERERAAFLRILDAL